MIKNAIKQGSTDEKRAKLEQESRRKKRRRTVEWNTATIHLVHLPTFFIYSKNCQNKIQKLKKNLIFIIFSLKYRILGQKRDFFNIFSKFTPRLQQIKIK